MTTGDGQAAPAAEAASPGGKALHGKKKILFAIHHLGGGGAERVIVGILRRLSREKFLPVLLVLENKGVYRSEVPGDVRVLDCGRYGAGGRWLWIRNFVRIVRQENPHVIVSFLWFSNLLALVCRFLSGVGCRLILSERSTIVGSREGVLTEAVRRSTIRMLYRFADRVVPNSEGLRRQLTGSYGLPDRKVTVVHNPLDVEAIVAQGWNDLGAPDGHSGVPTVVGMGRLSREKGFDLLIRAVAEVRTPARLVLIGEGPQEKSLRELAARLGITDRVVFTGFLRNPYASLARAELFVLPSRYEGFPNGLVEAMSLGRACVATRCPTGPEEIVTDGVDGLLVPVEDPAALAAAIDRLLEDPALRERLGCAARERVRAYDAPGIVRRFEDLIDEVAG